MTDQLFERLLGMADTNKGCDATFALLDRYAEAVIRGDDFTLKYAGVLAHLRDCEACREDAEGLVAAVKQLESTIDPR
jgi:hypothetical protein